MKRRTNLFYTGTENFLDDSNFLVFSNYTEHLTGTVLSTKFMLYPSRFLCLNIPNLDKTDFITNVLIRYYENKLAFLRDNFQNRDDVGSNKINDPDNIMNYLGYLIDGIYKYNNESEIVFVSEITEQNYNGTFADIICTIDSTKEYDKYEVTSNGEYLDNQPYEGNNLYGWTDDTTNYLPETFQSLTPIFDLNANEYSFNSKHTSINKVDEHPDKITFNVVIPLYDIGLMDIDKNDTVIENEVTNIVINILEHDEFAKNVPYGIWFANKDITLERADFKTYAPSWSLLIGTQFKPFPNSKYLSADKNTNSPIAGFSTFAEIMSKQTSIYDSLLNFKNEINTSFEDRLVIIEENKIKIESLEKRILELEKLVEKLSNPSSETKDVHKWIIKK